MPGGRSPRLTPLPRRGYTAKTAEGPCETVEDARAGPGSERQARSATAEPGLRGHTITSADKRSNRASERRELARFERRRGYSRKTGSRNPNSEPPSARDCAQTPPPICSMSERTMNSPIPAPGAFPAVSFER